MSNCFVSLFLKPFGHEVIDGGVPVVEADLAADLRVVAREADVDVAVEDAVGDLVLARR